MRVKTSFFFSGRLYPVGFEVASDDPAVAGREHLFVAVDRVVPVEAATAAPGEKRSVAKKTVAKKAAAKKVSTDV